MIRLIETALAAETDSAVRDAMQFSLLGAQLKAGSKTERLAAIEALYDSTAPRVRSLLGALTADPIQDEAVRRPRPRPSNASKTSSSFWAWDSTCSKASAWVRGL